MIALRLKVKNFGKTERRAVLKFVFIVIGAGLLLWYLAPLAAHIFNVGNAVGAFGSGVLILFGLFYDKLPCVPKYIIIGLFCLGLIAAIPLSVNMARYANYRADEAQTVIVLGCKVNGTRPSQYLYKRCAAAAEYMRENPEVKAVLSGGQGADEGISEAQCMFETLTEMGVDESRLLLEDKSTNTRENLELSKAIIEAQGLSKEVLIVTNEFHEYRAKLLCDKVGLSFHSKCSHSSFYTFLTFYTRELGGLVFELLH